METSSLREEGRETMWRKKRWKKGENIKDNRMKKGSKKRKVDDQGTTTRWSIVWTFKLHTSSPVPKVRKLSTAVRVPVEEHTYT